MFVFKFKRNLGMFTFTIKIKIDMFILKFKMNLGMQFTCIMVHISINIINIKIILEIIRNKGNSFIINYAATVHEEHKYILIGVVTMPKSTH